VLISVIKRSDCSYSLCTYLTVNCTYFTLNYLMSYIVEDDKLTWIVSRNLEVVECLRGGCLRVPVQNSDRYTPCNFRSYSVFYYCSIQSNLLSQFCIIVQYINWQVWYNISLSIVSDLVSIFVWSPLRSYSLSAIFVYFLLLRDKYFLTYSD
jgi:hypothetical protein